MVRLVRDLSQKANKKVDFQIEGEDTEVDKTVIEQITDPLVHIIRNGIDHGLETPEERQAAGKPPTGTLLLEAKYVGGEVWIVIEDDGRGLSREKILKKAVDRGLVDGDPDDVPDEKVWQLIFHPGFSTADKITDVSGRGVGMDVVKRNIENIRGKVDVTSKPGHGTQVVLRIPLTLAIIDGMLVRVGNDRFTLPITAIRESMQVDDGKLTKTMDGQEIIKIREDLIPIVRLHELLDIPTKVTELREGIITIVENEGDQVCLFVDELLGQQQIVIKGMSEYMGDHPCVSGCTILGDGDISLILDVAGIINEARNGSGPSGGKPAGESSRKSESQGEQQEVERS
jgi:two-component system chemotaxis sensor kinase CheA